MICLIFKTFESNFNLAEARVTRCTDFFPKLIHSDPLLRCWGQGDRVGECGYQPNSILRIFWYRQWWQIQEEMNSDALSHTLRIQSPWTPKIQDSKYFNCHILIPTMHKHGAFFVLSAQTLPLVWHLCRFIRLSLSVQVNSSWFKVLRASYRAPHCSHTELNLLLVQLEMFALWYLYLFIFLIWNRTIALKLTLSGFHGYHRNRHKF